jgi:translation initiation factor 2 subunit 3
MTSIMNQPIINIGMLGSVSDGKSTTVYSLTGVKTQRHSNEMKRNITIKPGYANMKIYKKEGNLNTKEGDLVHHISFIDCPGHYQLIVTMMSCIQLMDGIILVVSAAEPIEKKPQLIHHIMAIKMSGIKNLIVIFNKLDLIKKKVAQDRYIELVTLLQKYEIEPKIIIPASMNHNIGTDYLLKSIMKYMGPEIKNINNTNPLFMTSRSFDINHVNIKYDELQGGVIGGSLINGELKVGDTIEILPGIIIKNSDGTQSYKPHITKIISLKSETTELEKIIPGGLIGIGTEIDPFYCKNDNMAGMMIGLVGTLPPVYFEIIIKYTIIQFDEYIWNKRLGSTVSIIAGTNCVDGNIREINDEYIKLKLAKPACIADTKIIICSKSAVSFNIVAYGNLCNDYKFIEQIIMPIITNTNVNESTLSDDSIDIDDI